MTFTKPKVHRDELVETLERILASVKQSDPADFGTRRTITAPSADSESSSDKTRTSTRRRRRPTVQP